MPEISRRGVLGAAAVASTAAALPGAATAINAASADAQKAMLGRSPVFGPVLRAIHGG